MYSTQFRHFNDNGSPSNSVNLLQKQSKSCNFDGSSGNFVKLLSDMIAYELI